MVKAKPIKQRTKRLVSTNKSAAQVRESIKEHYPELPELHLAFFVEYINNRGNATAAYQSVYPGANKHSASVLGSKILSGIEISTILDLMGFGLDTINQAMTTLLENDPDKFMKYQVTLRKWDKKQVELSGKVDMPIVNIISSVSTGEEDGE